MKSISFLGTRYEIAGQVPQSAEEQVYENLQDIGDDLLLQAVKNFKDAYKTQLLGCSVSKAGFKQPSEGQTEDTALQVMIDEGGEFIIVDGWKRYVTEFNRTPSYSLGTYILRTRDNAFFIYAKL